MQYMHHNKGTLLRWLWKRKHFIPFFDRKVFYKFLQKEQHGIDTVLYLENYHIIISIVVGKTTKDQSLGSCR